MASSVLNKNAASALASSVFPTPVGPRNMKLAMGPLGSLRSALLRWIAVATAATASFWPIMRLCSSAPSCSSLSRSELMSLAMGMPVHCRGEGEAGQASNENVRQGMNGQTDSGQRHRSPDLEAKQSMVDLPRRRGGAEGGLVGHRFHCAKPPTTKSSANGHWRGTSYIPMYVHNVHLHPNTYTMYIFLKFNNHSNLGHVFEACFSKSFRQNSL